MQQRESRCSLRDWRQTRQTMRHLSAGGLKAATTRHQTPSEKRRPRALRDLSAVQAPRRVRECRRRLLTRRCKKQQLLWVVAL
jgi:hypothetical protein